MCVCRRESSNFMDGCKQWIRIKDNHIHRIHSMLGDLNANIPMLTVHRHNAMNLNRPTSVRELEWPELAERKRMRFKQKTSIVYRILSSWIEIHFILCDQKDDDDDDSKTNGESIHELVDFVVEHGAFSFFQLVFSLIFLFLASAFSALNSPFRAPHLSLARQHCLPKCFFFNEQTSHTNWKIALLHSHRVSLNCWNQTVKLSN